MLAAAGILVLLALLLTMNASRSGCATDTSESGDRRGMEDHRVHRVSSDRARDHARPRWSHGARTATRRRQDRGREAVFKLEDVEVTYGGKLAVARLSIELHKHEITALIGPSGCGKSTLSALPEPDERPDPRRGGEGKVLYHGEDLYARGRRPGRGAQAHRDGLPEAQPVPEVDLRQHRLRPAGPRDGGRHGRDRRARAARAALWDEVKDRLKDNAFGMSGGQQQRLCIARALAVEPDVILMDEPCSALDPISTGRIEDLMLELKEHYSIVIVTHNMQQAARVSDRTAFFIVDLDEGGEPPHRPTGRVRRPRRSSRTPTTPAPRTTSPGRSASDRCPSAHADFTGGARAARGAGALGGLDLVVDAAGPRDGGARAPGRRAGGDGRPDDDRIDGRYLEVHQGILSLLALQAPVAGDLRVVAALLHVIRHVERMGDQCVNIAQADPARRPRAAGPRGPDRAVCCGWAACPLPGRAVQAGASASATSRSPRTSSARTRRSTRSTARSSSWRIEIGDDAGHARVGDAHDARRARALERIGDNAVDIGEQTAFVVTGLFREFSDSSHPVYVTSPARSALAYRLVGRNPCHPCHFA